MTPLTRIHVVLLLGVLAACGGGRTDIPGLGPVTVGPRDVTLKAGEKTTFTATVPGAPQAKVLWSVEGGDAHGTITSTGVYTAPTGVGSYTVVATNAVDPSQTDSATVTVAAATGSTYPDPPGTGWRLVRNAGASSGNKLVLDLVGPADQSGRGVDLTLAVDPEQASWVKVNVSDTEYVANQRFELGGAPQLIRGVAHAGTLTVGVYQKGAGTAAVSYSGGLVSVALELKPGASTPAGTVIALSVIKAHALPASGPLTPISVDVGTITAR